MTEQSASTETSQKYICKTAVGTSWQNKTPRTPRETANEGKLAGDMLGLEEAKLPAFCLEVLIPFV